MCPRYAAAVMCPCYAAAALATPAAAVAVVRPRSAAAVTNPAAAAAVAVPPSSPPCRPLLLWCLALLRLLLCVRAILPLRCPPLLLMLRRSCRAPGRLRWPVKNRQLAVMPPHPCLLLIRTPSTRRWVPPKFSTGKMLVMLRG